MPLQLPFPVLPVELEGRLRKYTIAREDNRELKHGYMSVIYKARGNGNQDVFALKTIWRLKDPSTDEETNWRKAVRQFDVEISTLERLKGTPGIVQVRDRGQCDELPWYAMDYIDGKEITMALKGIPLHEQVRTLRKVVKALSQAHQKGIVHLDLKPSNILVDNGNEPVVLDFGISKVVELAWETISMSTGILGTPRYMAPEQFDTTSRSTTDLHQIDIWALGVLFYEILVADHPLGVSDSDMYDQMVHKILGNDIRDLSSFGKEVDRALAEICYRALSKDKAHRYKNAAEMFQDLNQWESANFDKCMTLAEEYIQYQHWQEAQRSAIEAHVWSPYHPKIKEYLIRALSGQYGADMRLEWVESISQDMASFWLKSRRHAPPKCLAQIYSIHNENPYFIAVDSPRGTSLREFLDRRESIGVSGVLDYKELKILLANLQEILSYFDTQHLTIRGLQMENIYCELDQNENIHNFYFWGIGWVGDVIIKPMEAIRPILFTSLSNESIAVEPKIEKIIKQSTSIEELCQSLEKSWKEDEDDEL